MSFLFRSGFAALSGLFLLACGGSDAPDAGPPEGAGSVATASAVAAVPDRSGVRSTVLGTLDATVEGETKTWYVVAGSSNGEPYASAMWMGEAPGERQVVAGGFDSRTPPLETFERDPSGMARSYGDYHGSVLTVHLSEALGTAPVSLRFPSDMAGEASVFYQPRATLENMMDATYWLAEGGLEVTSFTIEGGTARLEGTFSGVFRSMNTGESLRITDGRFSIGDVPGLAEIGG